MLRNFFLTALTVVVLSLTARVNAPTIATTQGLTYDQMQVHDLIVHYSFLYGVDPHWMLGVAYCESTWQSNPAGTHVGPFQFARYDGVWSEATSYGRQGIPPDAVSIAEQIRWAILLFSEGFGYHWSCRVSYMANAFTGYYLNQDAEDAFVIPLVPNCLRT